MNFIFTIKRFLLTALFVFQVFDACAAQSVDKVADFGRKLFYDAGLSRNGDVSCASCHQPARAFSDGRQASIGTAKQAGARNTPSLLDAGEGPFFWDGRAQKLEEVVLQPITNPVEMGLADNEALLQKLRQSRDDMAAFAAAFPGSADGPQARQVQAALSAYIRSLRGASAVDRYIASHDPQELSASARHGMALFQGVERCATCHTIEGSNPSLSDGRFHSTFISPETARALPATVMRFGSGERDLVLLGRLIESDPLVAEMGRYALTREPSELAMFRTPSLRNVARTAPYMHDGKVKTLREAVDREIYYRSLQENRTDAVTEQDRADLVAFLESLSDEPGGADASAPAVSSSATPVETRRARAK
jgi:cytochrome c peroxidase